MLATNRGHSRNARPDQTSLDAGQQLPGWSFLVALTQRVHDRKAPRIRSLPSVRFKEVRNVRASQKNVRGGSTRVGACHFLDTLPQDTNPTIDIVKACLGKIFCFRRAAHPSSPGLFQHCPESALGGISCRGTAEAVHSSASDIDRESVQDVHRTAPTMHRLRRQTRHKYQRVYTRRP